MKKSIVISLLTAITLFATAICSFASTGVVTADTLRLIKEASTDSSTIALLSVNDKVEILGEEEYGWYKVKSGEHVGYVAAKYINVLASNTNQVNNNLNKDEDNQTNENTDTNTNNQENNTETILVLKNGEKLYITPVINALAINTITEEKPIEIVSEVNGWSYIKQGTKIGWVRTENIQRKQVENKVNEPENNNNNSSQKVGYISGGTVNFRKVPNSSGEILKTLSRNDKIIIIESGEDWAEVEYNGVRGYIATDYISDKAIETTSRGGVSRASNSAATKTEEVKAQAKETEVVTLENVTGADVVAFAKNYLGYKYVSGGSSPSKGFDCSGFTTYIYKHFGITLSRTSSGQSGNGKTVAKSDMKAGDIICFSNSSGSKKIGHVGIYVGGGKFIHAANSRKGVIISNVSGDGYYFVVAKRIID